MVTDIAAFDPKEVKKFENSPYYIVSGRGLAIKEGVEPTEDQAEEMLAFIEEWNALGDIMVAHYLATLPKKYGRTLNKALGVFGKRLGEKRLFDLRGFGKACPAQLVVQGVSLSHHMTLYWDFRLSQPERDKWMEELLLSSRQPGANGRMWSVETLRQKIREQKGLPSGKVATPTDNSHDATIEDDKLRTDLWHSQSELVLLEKIITEDIIPGLEQSGDEATIAAIETLRDLIEEKSLSVPAEPVWYFKPNGDGQGGELMWKEVIAPDQELFMYIHDDNFPRKARKDLIKKLNAKEV